MHDEHEVHPRKWVLEDGEVKKVCLILKICMFEGKNLNEKYLFSGRNINSEARMSFLCWILK